MTVDTFNPLRLYRNGARLAHLIAGERIGIVDAHCAAAACRRPHDRAVGYISRTMIEHYQIAPGRITVTPRAVGAALAMNVTICEALGACTRPFAESAFSPQSVAEAVGDVYTSLLTRDS